MLIRNIRMLTASLITLSLFASAPSFAQEDTDEERKGGKKKRKPPAEALAVCEGATEEQACSFQLDDKTISGMCKAPPRGLEGPLACVPERGQRK